MTTDGLDLAKLKTRWRGLDDDIRAGWDADMRTAQERDICESGPDWTWTETISKISGRTPEPKGNSETLLFLPFPFRPGAGRGAFPEMFAWDSYFVNLGLLAHGRYDLVRGALLNQLFMIMRHGKVLNGNRTYFSGRSQPPLHADAIWRYYKATGDRDMLLLSYPLLCREYREYWLWQSVAWNLSFKTERHFSTTVQKHQRFRIVQKSGGALLAPLALIADSHRSADLHKGRKK